MESVTQLDLLKERIEYDENIFTDNETYEKVLNRLLDDSKYIALSLRYPYQDYSSLELPKKYNNWQLRCCEELYNGIGTEGIKSYSENSYRNLEDIKASKWFDETEEGKEYRRHKRHFSYYLPEMSEINQTVKISKRIDVDIYTKILNSSTLIGSNPENGSSKINNLGS